MKTIIIILLEIGAARSYTSVEKREYTFLKEKKQTKYRRGDP